MRILIINPNTSEKCTALIAAEAGRAASAQTQLLVETAGFGVEYIETRIESAIAGYAVACAAAERYGEYDGVVVAAFGDPGLLGLKELLDCPVVGMTEAALATASLLGQRYSLIAISDRIASWYKETLEARHFADRLASIRSLKDPFDDIGTIQDDCAERLVELAHQAVREDGADVLVLAGAPLAGLARKVGDQLPVPVVDGVSCAVRQCEALLALKPGVTRAGSFSAPPHKPNRGLPQALASLLEGKG